MNEQIDKICANYEQQLAEKDEIISRLEAELHYAEEALQGMVRVDVEEELQNSDRRTL